MKNNEQINNLTGTEITVKNGIFYRIAKRIFDIFASFMGIILLSPLMLVLLIIVACSLKGAPIYVDKRIGKKGKVISVLKYRTMCKDAEENAQDYLNEEQMQEFKRERKVTNDPRVKGFGSFLRKSSLDELPQLFNILIGSMSFIGPRAVTQWELDDNYTPEQLDALLKVKPGLTGNWCTYGRYSANYENGLRQRLELEYLPKRGCITDLKLLLTTIKSVITLKDAKK